MRHDAAKTVRRSNRSALIAGALALPWVLALCAHAVAQTPADVLVTVSDAQDTYISGADVTYTVRIDNRGAQSIAGIVVDGPLPDGIADARWTCAATAGAKCGTGRGTGALRDRLDLPAGASATYRVTLAVPANRSAGTLDYRVGATLPPGHANAAAGALVATDSNTLREASAAAGAGLIAPRSDRRAGAAVLSDTTEGLLGGNLRAPFTCNADMFISQGPDNSTRTTLYRVDTTVTPFVLTAIGTNNNNFAYNALGYNPADNFLYAIRVGTRALWRIHSDGTTEGIGQISGLPALDSSNDGDTYNSADIGTDGFMYVKRQGSRNTIYRIDLAPLTSGSTLSAQAISLSQSIDGADLAWIPDVVNSTSGSIYSVNTNGRVVRINPTSGAVTVLSASNSDLFPNTTNNNRANIGALFGSPSGLFGSRNSPAEYYQFDLTTGRATRVSLGDRTVSVNDGAHCPNAPVELYADLRVTKTNTPAQGPSDLPNDTYAPGTEVTYTIVVSNAGPSDVHDVPVQDPLPAGITTARWTCSATGTGSCGSPSGTGALNDLVTLAANGTATYLFTIEVPANHAQTQPALTNTVTVSLPDGFIDPTPDDLAATDTDTAGADLRVVKTTPSQSVLIDETLTYTITVSNPGSADVVNAVLTDTADARLDCPGVSATASCTASNGAICPSATVAVASLLGSGVTIPSLPAGSSLILTLACRVTQ